MCEVFSAIGRKAFPEVLSIKKWKKNKQMKKTSRLLVVTTFIVIYIFLAYVAGHVSASDLFKPTWLKQDVYAEYTFKSGVVWFSNLTEASYESSMMQFDEGIFRWTCTDLNETTAELRIDLNLTNGANVNRLFSTYVSVDAISRGVYLQNGTLLGNTHLWLPANPNPNDDIVLWNLPPDQVTLRIQDSSEYFNTPQGSQKVFSIAGEGTIDGENALFTVTCDFDTGVLVDGGLDYEPTLYALGIKNLFYNGQFSFAGTNIDLGPNDTPFNILTLLPLIAIPTACIIIFVVIYSRRRKRF